MSKVKLLLDVVQDIRSLADSLQAVAEAVMESELKEMETTEVPKNPEPDKKDTGKRSTSKAEPEPSVPAEPVLTLEQVRAVLAEKSRAGHTVAVKALLLKHGADKLSDIDPVNYAALLADAEVL